MYLARLQFSTKNHSGFNIWNWYFFKSDNSVSFPKSGHIWGNFHWVKCLSNIYIFAVKLFLLVYKHLHMKCIVRQTLVVELSQFCYEIMKSTKASPIKNMYGICSSRNMDKSDLPNMYAWSLRAEVVHIRQISCVYVAYWWVGMGDKSAKISTPILHVLNTSCTQYLGIEYFLLRIQVLIPGITWFATATEA